MVRQNFKPRMATAVLVATFGLGLITPAGAAPANVDPQQSFAGSRGTLDDVGFGRSRALFGRHATLRDMALPGAGLALHRDALGAASVGHGFGATDFVSRFQYATPTVSGLQMSLGAVDPVPFVSPAGRSVGSLVDDNRGAYFAGEMSYSSVFVGGSLKAWVDALWQSSDVNASTNFNCANFDWDGDTDQCADSFGRGWGVGSKFDYLGFELVGYLRDGHGLGASRPFDHKAVGGGDAYFVEGSYAFSGKTKVGVSYGEGNLNGIRSGGIAANTMGPRLEHQLWTVGVYHDVSSWLRLIAEYNHGELNTQTRGKNPSGNTISVGSFLYW